MTTRRVAMSAVVAAVMLSAFPAHAEDHVGPRAVLVSAETRQTGRAYHSDWIRETRDGKACLLSGGSGSLTVPRQPVPQEADGAIVVRLKKSAGPREVQVRRWPRVDEHGDVTGEPTPVPFLLKPHAVDGDVRAWDVVVAPILQAGHVYLDVAGWWADEDGCWPPPDLGSQYKAWLFHLRTVP